MRGEIRARRSGSRMVFVLPEVQEVVVRDEVLSEDLRRAPGGLPNSDADS